MPKLSKHNNQELDRTLDMVLAQPSDLYIGKEFYLVRISNPKKVTPMVIRSKVKKLSHYGQDETEEEYQEYRNWIMLMIKDGLFLIKKEKKDGSDEIRKRNTESTGTIFYEEHP